jgi:hypothetical protein
LQSTAGLMRVFWQDLFKRLLKFVAGAKIRLLVGIQHIFDLWSTFSLRGSWLIKDDIPSKYVAQNEVKGHSISQHS